MDNKNYNSQRGKLLLPEYGRHVQTMIEQLLDIEAREERNREARAVIAVMGNINPFLRDTEDFRHKLWDHMFIISDFKLDVDSPYPKISPQELIYNPKPLNYPTNRIRHKQYGQSIKNMIQAIKSSDDQQAKMTIAGNLAKFMKFKSYEYNKEFPSNDVIINDIKEFSGASIVLDDDTLNNTKIAYKPVAKPNKKNVVKRNQNSGGPGAKYHRNNNTNTKRVLVKK